MSEPIRRARVKQHGVIAGDLESLPAGEWQFGYLESYVGEPVSLTLPVRAEPYVFPGFPAVFEGLLPEGPQLEAVLRLHKIDRHDSFRLLLTVGHDVVGSLTVEEAT
jgi:serine/threonine-protein kinase HipA